MRTRNGPSGRELAARRKAEGLTQVELAQRAEVGRSAVQYWEAKQAIDPRSWAVVRMASALRWSLSAWSTNHYAHAGGWGNRPDPHEDADAKAAVLFEAWKAREAQRAATRRVVCGAQNRKGTPCRNKSEPGRQRCKFHGGMSTGARTPEGIERIREAQKRRWAAWQQVQASGTKSHSRLAESPNQL